jgi:hypothetical protein
MLSHEEKIRISKKKKKIFIIGILIVIGVFALVGITLLILSGVQHQIQEKRLQAHETPRQSYNYPDTDWDRNIFEESFYMGLDREIKYSDGIAVTAINEGNRHIYPVEAQFMHDVVNMIINGDYEAYNGIFADEYYDIITYDDLRLEFPMQPLYNIEMQIIAATETSTDVKLSYKIYRNDGMFRNDMSYNDGEILPVIYRLVRDSENEIKVSSVRVQLAQSGY